MIVDEVGRWILGLAVRPAPREVAAPSSGGASGRRFGMLLDRALGQSTAEAEDALLDALLHALVPDEARIVAALAAREWSPLVHVEPRRVGEEHLGLRNASLVGRQAGVALVRRTPLYVTRLLDAGLVKPTPERAERAEEYEVLLAEPDVLDAIRSAGRGPVGPRIRRAGLALSDLGELLWSLRQGTG